MFNSSAIRKEPAVSYLHNDLYLSNIHFYENFRAIIVKTNVNARKFFGNQSTFTAEIRTAIKDAVNASAVQFDGKTFFLNYSFICTCTTNIQ